MNVLQVTNLISPHQMPLAHHLAETLGDGQFRLAATLPMSTEMGKRGWRNDEAQPWILRVGESESHRAEFDHWWDQADVVITGHLSIDLLAHRVRKGKLTFYMSERWWKPPVGIARLLHPRFAWTAYRFARLAHSPFFHYLPMGGFAASDMGRIASFRGRMWDWGYFTSVPTPLPPVLKRGKTLQLLWAGRMLAWKRVDTLLRALAIALQTNIQTHLTLIGDGPCLGELQGFAEKLGIADHVSFQPSLPAVQVRDQMRKAHAYILPSSPYEGWGAVLNEAMSEGCAVVASSGAGSARTIIRHGENGLLFRPGDHYELAALLLELDADELLRRRIAEEGQRTISECWSPTVAAERFLAVSDALLSKHPVPSFDHGPMAHARERQNQPSRSVSQI